jgi:AcrR family transcriptional regulator
MARPSLAEQRRPQLLDAYASCLVRYGVEGTTLDRVAEEAGVTRGLVRHYLGNRDEIERALGEHVREGYAVWLEELVGMSDREDRLDAAIDGILSEQPRKLYSVIDALFREAPLDPQIAGVLREIYTGFEHAMDVELAAALPASDAKARRRVAYAIVCMAFAETDFDQIGFRPDRREAARGAARTLVDSLR